MTLVGRKFRSQVGNVNVPAAEVGGVDSSGPESRVGFDFLLSFIFDRSRCSRKGKTLEQSGRLFGGFRRAVCVQNISDVDI